MSRPTFSAPVPVLFESATCCCGCGACAMACPADAISMVEDETGFAYPRIDESMCVRCGRCKQVCGFQLRLAQESAGPFFAAATSEAQIERSASGGVFGALARAMVARGGAVVGCAYEHEEGELVARHRVAEDEAGIDALLGSKYVQSDAAAAFPRVRELLREGREVLFSGTPCQVAGLRGYLGGVPEGLLTVDLVCHGVPSSRLLNGYLMWVEGGDTVHLRDVRFRDKRRGWDGPRELVLCYVNGVEREIGGDDSSYYDLFYSTSISRDSCYACPFAGRLRPADLTIGDFWGVEKVRPDLLAESGGPFDTHRGVSCLLVNNERGTAWLERLGSRLVTSPVTFGQVAENNDQLRNPAVAPRVRTSYLSAFHEGGWPAVERVWRCRKLLGGVHRAVAHLLPSGLKRAVKRVMGA